MPEREKAQREQIAKLKEMILTNEQQLNEMREFLAEIEKTTAVSKRKRDTDAQQRG